MEIFNLEDFEKKYINKNLVIQASAGTGKTYSIKMMVRKLVENGKDINKILIVTYTDKATGELKDRIRNELSGLPQIKDEDLDNLNIYTIHSFSQNAIKEFGLNAKLPLNLDVIDEKEAVSEFFDRYVRSNQNLLNDIDQIKKDFNVEGGDNSKDLKKYFVNLLMNYYLNKDNNIDDSIISINNIKDIKFDDIKTNKEIFDAYNILKNSKDIEVQDKAIKFEESINNKTYKFSFTIRAPYADEEAAFNYFEKIKGKKYDQYIDFDELLKNEAEINKNYGILKNHIEDKDGDRKSIAESLKKLVESIKTNFNKDKKINFRVKIEKWPEDDNEKEALKIIGSYIDKIKKLNDNKYIEIILNYIDDFYIEWQEEKRNNKSQTFNDMLRNIRETLLDGRDDSFKNALKNKYEYAIIDEFQDTNQLQFDTFKSIFMEDQNHHIIVVGDPKQSIYAFQGADLNVYQKAIKEIINNGGIELSLDTNRRSSKSMINSCNSFFNNVFNDGTNNITFNDSKSPKDNNRCAYLDGIETKSFWLTKEALLPKDFAKAVVLQIVELCKITNGETKLRLKDKEGNIRNVTFKDFTVLARSRPEMSCIIRELKKYGIPFIKYKDNNLFFSNECFHFVTILEAINSIDFTGSRRKLFKKALFTDFFNLSLYEINTTEYERDDSNEFKLFNKWKIMAINSKWEDLFDDILFESKLLSNLRSLDKLQSLTIYKQISNYSISYLYNNHSLEDLIYKLKGYQKDDGDEDSSTIEIGTDFDCVKLMTIHASKGLQFPIVISAAGFKGPIIKKDFTLSTYHDANDFNKRKITFDYDEQLIDLKEEWKRLLYVCYTRAEYINIIPYYLPDTKSDNFYYDILNKNTIDYINIHKDDYRILNINNIYTAKVEDVKKEVIKILGKDNDKDYGKINEERKELIEKVKKESIIKYSYSSLSHSYDEKDNINNNGMVKTGNTLNEISLKEYDESSKQILSNVMEANHQNYDKFPKGASIGTALHEMFERIDFTNYNNDLDIIKDRLKANGIKIGDDLITYINNMINNALNANLKEIKGNDTTNIEFKLNSISKDDKKAEIEFNYNIDNNILKDYCNGFIDLIIKRGDYYSILDWKSDTLNDKDLLSYYNNDSLKLHTDNCYSIQRVLYSYCLIKWLKNIYNESEEDIFNNHFGGVYYVYIRGCINDLGNGIYQQTWASYNDLLAAYNKIIDEKVNIRSNK